jgi:endonuclease III
VPRAERKAAKARVRAPSKPDRPQRKPALRGGAKAASRGAASREQSARAVEIIDRLRRAIPDATIALEFSNPLELIVATILSAQCTDARVNIVTRDLFKTYRSAADYAGADAAQFEKEIHSAGFFRAKTKSILGMARALVERHGGDVPRTMEELTKLPGVGRKTANVILGNAFGIPGIAVDTHVTRVAQRLGLTKNADPVKIETDLGRVVPEESWTEFSHLIIHHGRRTCHARNPKCPECVLLDLCPEGRRRTRGTTAAVRPRGAAKPRAR